MLAASWTPNSRFILTVSEFKVRMTVWDLKLGKGEKQKPQYIECPKFEDKGIAFSTNQMTLIRKFVDNEGQSKDMVSIFDTHKWQCKFSFFP